MASPPPTRSRSSASVQATIIALAIVPCLVFTVGGLGIGWYLADQAMQRKAAADLVVRRVDTTERLWTAVLDEQRAGATGTTGDLTAARTRVDTAAAEVRALATDPAAVPQSLDRLRAAVDALPDARRAVRAQPGGVTAYTAFDGVVDAVTAGLAGGAADGTGSDVTAAFAGADATLHVARSVLATATVASLAPGQTLDRAVYPAFAAEAAALPGALGPVAAGLDGPDRDAVTALAADPQWKAFGRDVTDLLGAGPTTGEPTRSTTAPTTAAPTTVSPDLVAEATTAGGTLSTVAFGHARTAAALQAGRAADALDTLVAVVLGGVGIAVLMMVIGFRAATRLVRRLTTLREDTLEAAGRLPSVLERLRLGEEVDVRSLTTVRDHGADEIGQIASAVDVARRAAVDAAAEEARTLAGANAVFLNIAHRSQAIVHRQLQVLDEAERAEHNSDQLARLFQLDHLTTRERRNAENLIIMGGQQPRRRWRRPVAMIELLRSAISESEQYTRITLGDVPDTYVDGAAVGDLIHLIAELVDNATSFSPPQCDIDVRATTVGRGIVIEVQDRGLGIDPEPRARLNAMLADPPDFGLMTLSEDSRLGMFVVARLAHQHGIRVTLMESPYGGVQCIVLVPNALVVEPEADPEDEAGNVDGDVTGDHLDALADDGPDGTTGDRTEVARNGTDTGSVGTVPVPEPTASPEAGPPPLPERQPQEHLAAKLRDDTPTVVGPPGATPTGVTADDAPQLPVRSSTAMSALQRGSRNGRGGLRPGGDRP